MQEKDVAYDIFQEVIIDLFEKVKLGTLEKREENTSKMILKWVNQHLEWKRLTIGSQNKVLGFKKISTIGLSNYLYFRYIFLQGNH
jgi:hypothetical protein